MLLTNDKYLTNHIIPQLCPIVLLFRISNDVLPKRLIKPDSPVENQNDLELDFKVFFFVDSCCWGIVINESNWCHSGIIERFEIFKMAPKMTVS